MKKQYFGFIILTLFCLSARSGDLNLLYQQDNDRFWEVIREEEKKFVNCSPNIYFLFAIETLRNSEVSQWNADVIEAHAIKAPKCVLDSLISLEGDAMELVVETFLVRTLYKDVNQIEQSFRREWSDKEYTKVRNIFLVLKEKVYGS